MEKMYGQTGADTEKLCLKKWKKRWIAAENGYNIMLVM